MLNLINPQKLSLMSNTYSNTVEWSQWIILTNPECEVFYETIHFMQNTSGVTKKKIVVAVVGAVCRINEAEET